MAKKITSLSQKTDEKLAKAEKRLENLEKERKSLIDEIKEYKTQQQNERSAGIGKAFAEKGIDMNKLNEALQNNTELLNMLLGICAEDSNEEQEKSEEKKEEPAPAKEKNTSSDGNGKKFNFDVS